MTAGLIVNPRSGSASGKGLALARMLASDPHVRTAVIERFEALPEIISGMAAAGVTTLFISSGDGTIQAIQTELAERSPFPAPPRLALLPHGTTNMTAADLGFRARSLAAQADMIRTASARETVERPTLRIANPGDGLVRHGMFLGGGAITAATAYTQSAFNARGIKGNWPVFRTLSVAVLKALFSRPDPTDAARFDRPHAMTVTAEGRVLAEGGQLLLLASTLEKLVLGATPFRNEGEGAIRLTVLPYPPPNLLRWTLPILRGALPPGTPGGRVGSFGVTSPSGYVVDGEFFDGPEAGALCVETGPRFTYVRA